MFLFYISFVIKPVLHSVVWAIPQTVLTYFKNANQSCKLSIRLSNKLCPVTCFSYCKNQRKILNVTFSLAPQGQKSRQRKKSVTFQLPSDSKHVLALNFLSWMMVRMVNGSWVNFSQQKTLCINGA